MAEATEGVSQSREFDAEILSSIARSHGGALFRRALRLTHGHDDAWDLVQDTLLRALDGGLERTPLDKVCRWLFVVMGRLHVDRRRRARRRATVAFDEDVFPPLTLGEPTEEPLWQEVEYEDVRQHLSELDPRVREAYVLHEEQGLSLADTARRLRVPVATAGTRVFRARRRLRALLLEPIAVGRENAVSDPTRLAPVSPGARISHGEAAER